MLWATNHTRSKHLLLQPVLAEGPQAAAPLTASRGVPSLRILGSWGPRGVRGLAARVRPSASQPWWRPSPGARPPARGQRSSPPRAGGGPGAASRAPPGLRGPEPESRRHTPSPPGLQSGAPSVPQRRAAAQLAPPVSTARPLFPAWVSAAPAPGRLRGSFARSAPPMEEPELPALRGGSRGRGRGRPRGSTLSAGPRPSGAPASRVRSGARAQLARAEAAPAGTRASHRAIPGRRGCREPGAEMPRGGSGCEQSPGGSASQRTRAPLATSVTLQEPGPEPRRRRCGPARAARSVLPTSGAGAGCGASGQLVASRLSPPAPRELAGGNSARPL